MLRATPVLPESGNYSFQKVEDAAMALADPQSVTIGGTAVSLPRTSTGVNASTYTSADSAYALSITHQYGAKSVRRAVRLTSTKVTTDPLAAGLNIRVGATVSIALNAPVVGYSATELKDLLVGAANAITASSAALATKLVGGEN